ncbi:karyopherin Cut15 [Reticulomyxa filosa]|uniref:Karyopherin Cut15 n=1 Tax=Reticulomyxa filosa TaxID=46433 RepID=X6MUD5_RETFI|nr:karyopherin Cut15 [Reticulomyxa filosa]|eukprot:ETO17281.1 karyopherin Cut15 [Reticulomyxa filosa]
MIEKLDSFPENMKRNTVWTISNFCRGKPPPDWDKISKVIPPLVALLVDTKDYDVTVDILWAISFLSEDREENETNGDNNENNNYHHYQIDAILQTGVMKYIITLVKHAQQLALDAFNEINEVFVFFFFWKIHIFLFLSEPFFFFPDRSFLKIQAANENPSRDIEIPNQVRQKLTTSDFLIAPCVRIMGNIVSGNDEQTLEVVKAGFFDIIETCLDHRVKNIKKESCWALSNVVAGLHEHIDLFFHRKELIELYFVTFFFSKKKKKKHICFSVFYGKVIKLCLYDDVNVRKEAGWCLSNAICSASFTQAQILVKYGFIEAMVQLLTFDAEKVVMMAMEALHECIITYNRHFNQPENAFNKWAGKMEEVNGLEYLERIQGSESFSEPCFNMAATFVTKFWDDAGQFNEADTDDNELGKGGDDQNFIGLNDDTEIGNNTDPYQF